MSDICPMRNAVSFICLSSPGSACCMMYVSVSVSACSNARGEPYVSYISSCRTLYDIVERGLGCKLSVSVTE